MLTSTNDACQLNLPQLPLTAREAHLIPGLTHSSLISIGKLCDSGCTAIFDAQQVSIRKNNETPLIGSRDHTNGLWRLPLQITTTVPPTIDAHEAYNNAHQTQSIPALINYLHAAAFSPATSTWLQAIQKGFFSTWPGLTTTAVKKYLQPSEATAKGHLDQTRKNARSTKGPTLPRETSEAEPTQEPNNQTTNWLFATIESTGKIYTNQTGRFPVTSSQGSKYVLVLYDYDTNAILTEALKNRTAPEILRAYHKLFQYLQARGFTPQTHWLDNEASQQLKDYNQTQMVTFQLVPPHMHRRNAAEQAIRTWKNHFVAGLCSTHPQFPMHLWDRLLQQATMTLNLLRPSRRNPRVSAYTMLEGNFDYNRTPLAPPGTKIIVHEKPQQRLSWDPHGTDGWYLGPTMEHYRCHRVFITKTKAERITNTVEFFHHKHPPPMANPTELAIHAVNDLVKALEQPHPIIIPTPKENNQLRALKALAEIFHHKPTKTIPSPRVTNTNQATLPRVVHTPSKQRTRSMQQPQTNDVTPSHCYPTRHTIPYQPDEAHLVCSVITAEPPTVQPTFAPTPQWANAIIDPDTGASMEYRHLIKSDKHRPAWLLSFANELGRLTQGVGTRTPGTDTIFFIPHSQIPTDRRKDVTYRRICVDLRPQKEEINRTRLTVGGNLIDYPGDVSTPTADTTTAKIIINSTISTPGAKFMCGDIKNFYLGTPMD